MSAKAILAALGAAIAAAAGGILLGASLATGIIIGGIVATLLVSYIISKEKQKQQEAFDKLFPFGIDEARSIPQGTAIAAQAPAGAFPQFGQLSREDIIGIAAKGSTTNITVSPNFEVNVADKEEFKILLDENNKNLVDEILRLVKT